MRIVDDLIADPVAFVPTGKELDFSGLGISVLEANWGESDIDIETTLTDTGVVVSRRQAKPREPVLSLGVREEGEVDLPTAAFNLQAKVGEWERRGGWLQRNFIFGGKFAGSLACKVHKASIDGLSNWKIGNPDPVTLKLLTDGVWYATVEVESATFSETSARQLVFELSEVLGTAPGLIRIRVTNDNASAHWRGLIYAAESRDHPGAATKDTTARLDYLAEDLTPKGGATVSGGVVEHSSLTADWLSILGSGIRPTIRAVGAVAAGTGAISPGLPTGTLAGDLLIMVAESKGTEGELTASGWTKRETQVKGNTRLTILYKIAAGGDATTTNDTGDHQLARIIGVKKGTFDPEAPFNVSGASTQAATKSVSIPGATTTRDQCLVIACASGHLPDSTTTAEFGAATNASLSELTERIDNTTAEGDGGAIYAVSGYKTTAGTYSATTCTAVTEAERGVISVAVNPLASRYPTHKGPRRLWVRAEDGGAGDLELRLRWRALGSSEWTTNAIVPSPLVNAYQLLDLGECRPEVAALGDERWEFVLQARAPSGSGQVRVKDVYPLPTEQYVVLSAPEVSLDPDGQSQKSAGKGESAGWSNPENIKSSNNSYATVALSLGGISSALTATTFGHSIPEGATITGIMVEVERSATGGMVDSSARLLKAGSAVGDDKASPSGWPTTDAIATYGGSDDLWGTTWTPAQVNASNFGFEFRCESLGSFTASVDHIRITVYYTESADPNRVCFATRDIELRSNGAHRQHPTDDVWGRVVPIGFNPTASPSGLEERPTRAILISSQGDLGELADSGTNKLSAQALVRPGYHFAREAA